MKKNKIGEHPSVGEEILLDISEIEQKCRAVETSIIEEIFSLEEALSVYKVSRAEYLRYLDGCL